MTIESVSHPADLTEWDEKSDPFYLELFGETSPLVDIAYAEVVPAGPVDGAAKTSQPAPVYEYWWTIGHPGIWHERHGLLEHLGGGDKTLWEQLSDDVAARVYVYFPLDGGWRIKELAATVRYLSPIREEQSFWEKAAADWQVIQPIVDDASKLAAAAAPLQGGAAAAGTAKALDALAQMKLNSVPQVKGFEWSVGKVTFGSSRGQDVMQGIMWTLPQNMFTVLGGRLTGSVAVSFIPDHVQTHDAVADQHPDPQRRALLAHAVVYPKDRDPIWSPSSQEFVRLEVQPALP